MHRNREISGFLRTIAQSQSRKHVALGRDSHTRTATLTALFLDFLPQMILGVFHLVALWVTLNLAHDKLYLLHFQVNDVIHDTLSQADMFLELIKIKAGMVGKGILHVAVEVYTQQTTTVIRA